MHLRRYIVAGSAAIIGSALYATSGYQSGGTDLDSIFHPKRSGSSTPAATRYTVSGTDLNQRYYPLSDDGTAAAATSYKVSGADLNTLFAAKGTVFPYAVTFTGYSTWTVPSGCYVMRVKLWGAGGGTGASYRAKDSNQNWGGGGGFLQADVVVTPGQLVVIQPGHGGYGAYGNSWPVPTISGGVTGSSNHASGGGRSQVQISGVSTSTFLLIAGSGGAGGWGPYAYGGAGGGSTAGKGGDGNWYVGNSDPQYMSTGGYGGSQTAGGAAGTGGGSLQGQQGQYLSGAMPSTWLGSYQCGPGGGDGYYGGGSGGEGSSATSASGGGGGSNAAIGAYNVVTTKATDGSRAPANTSDKDYLSGYGYGASAGEGPAYGNDGASGIVVIRYDVDS